MINACKRINLLNRGQTCWKDLGGCIDGLVVSLYCDAEREELVLVNQAMRGQCQRKEKINSTVIESVALTLR